MAAPRADCARHRQPGALLAGTRTDRRILVAACRRQPGQRLCRQDLAASYWDDFLGRIPFVKTLYGGFRDVVSLLPSGSGEKRDLQRVVLARFADVHAIGFVTREDVPAVLLPHGGHDWVTVYFPMSYAFGGYTIYLPRDRISAARHLGRRRHATGDHRGLDCRRRPYRQLGARLSIQRGMLLGRRCMAVLALAATFPGVAGNVPGSAAPRSGSQSDAIRYQRLRAAAATVLAARADPEIVGDCSGAALHGLVRRRQNRRSGGSAGATAVELAARASELAPQNASIGWLQLQLCAGTPACDIRDAAIAMRWVDADNGAAWLQTLAAAQKEKDATEVERILADMAQGSRFDFYWNRIVVLMADALHAARGQLPRGFAGSDFERLTTAGGTASGEIIPPLTALVDACRESSTLAERRELCLKLSKTMQHGDTIAAQMAGFSIEKRLHAPDSKEVRAIAERRHLLEWRVAAAAKFDDPLLPWTRNARARVRLAHMRTLPREEDVCIAILRDHKMALEPPEAHP